MVFSWEENKMDVQDLTYDKLSSVLEKTYGDRASDFPKRFLKWFLENILRLDDLTADDACVDGKHDKGVDAIYVDVPSEIIYIVQSKTKTSPKATLGDTELKDFCGTLIQFSDGDKIKALIEETKNERLKQALVRSEIQKRVEELGYAIQGVFITNVVANEDGLNYVAKLDNVILYDATAIADKYIDFNIDGGIKEVFEFDVSDSEVIAYDAGGANARIFLAPALNLTRMNGISDGSLFEQNVRLSLGNTRVNKSIKESIKKKGEHKKFPLYHNGINVLCQEILEQGEQKIIASGYVVVNGAQSLTALLSERSKITDDLKILVKLIEIKDDISLAQAITKNSNNQNAIKSRDMKSNHALQQRLKKEVQLLSNGEIAYEIKQGENNRGKKVISNEHAGLILLAADLEQPWNCHQKYKIMGDSYSTIFEGLSVTAVKIILLHKCFESIDDAMKKIKNRPFANYTLTKYFLFYAVFRIIKEGEVGRNLYKNIGSFTSPTMIEAFSAGFSKLATATAIDINSEISSEEDEHFDYKNDLKSSKWCMSTSRRLVALHIKDVERDKADAIATIFSSLL